MNGQFARWVEEAKAEVHDRGLASSQQAIMLVGFGAVLDRLESRVIKVNGKLIGSLLVALGGGVGAAIAKGLGL